MGNFWDSVGEKLADRWAAVSVPALVFWLGGLLAWISSQGGFHALKAPADWLSKQPGPTQIAVVLVALLSVAASGVVVARLTTPVLRLMEGYWPRWLDVVRRPLAERQGKKADSIRAAFQDVAGPVMTGVPPPTPEQRAEYTRLTHSWRRFPGPGRYQPTRVGNTLRAGEAASGQIRPGRGGDLAAPMAAAARYRPFRADDGPRVSRRRSRCLYMGDALRVLRAMDAMGRLGWAGRGGGGLSALGAESGRSLCRSGRGGV